MKVSPAWSVAGLLAAGAICLLPGAARAEDALSAGFRNPPASARPHTWWHWINGNTTKEGITADLEAMKRVGVGGAQIFNVDTSLPDGNAPFMSDTWKDLILHAAKEANRLGIELCIHNGAGWSSSGGPWVTPEYSMQMLVFSSTPVHGGAAFTGKLPQPETRRGYYGDIEVLAYPTPANPAAIPNIRGKADYDRSDRIDPDLSDTPQGAAVPRDSIIDLTSKMDATGQLTWDAPAGEWTVLRIGHTTTGETNHPAPREGLGLENDKLSREAMDQFWSGMMATVINKLGPLAPKTLNNALIDSYEVGSQNWTPKFREEFIKRRGYDPMPFLPVANGVMVDDRATSERFLWDLRRTVADLFSENYYGYFTELCHKHGMLASTEPYGNGPFDNIQAGGNMDIPMGEFWVGGGTLETLKLASSVGHIYGRQVIGAESFTADDHWGRWTVDPYSVKALGDQAFCLGLNRYIFHRYAMQPWIGLEPGMTMGPWGTHFERTETWWNPGASWLRYVARCQYMLQSGRFVADVIYFTGDNAPNDLPGRNGLNPKMPDGYDYDGCDQLTLRERMMVRNGLVVLPSGMRYRLLVLPNSRFMTLETLRKVRALVEAGATVVGPKPESTPSLTDYPRADEELKQIADAVWGDVDGKTVTEHGFGKGRVVWGKEIGSVLAAAGAQPDFAYTNTAWPARLLYIHRTLGNAEVYFVSNQRSATVQVPVRFRVSGMTPAFWHPDTGKMEAAPVWTVRGGVTEVPVRLEPSGSVFVVFRKTADTTHLAGSTFKPAVKLAEKAAPRIVITRAFYGPVEGEGGVDVTDKVRAMVAEGNYDIPADNANYGDPTNLRVKQLTLDYTINGKSMKKVIPENGTGELLAITGDAPLPPVEVAVANGKATVTAWQAGTLTGNTAAGKTVAVKLPEGAKDLAVTGSWSVHFPPKKGAPDHVTLPKLISWPDSDVDGVRYFSGTAEYRKTFDVPAALVASGRAVVLDLGRVKNLAGVKVNGKDLGVLWKPPFRVDVTGLLKPGKNSLTVQVTNLWVNRLIGDAHLPDDVEWAGDHIAKWPDWLVEGKPRPQTGRVAFATWRFFTKDSPLMESGLLGPVVVRSAPRVTVPLK